MSAPIVFTYIGLLGLYQFLNVDYGSNVLLFFQKEFSLNGGLDFPNYFASSDSNYWNFDTRIQGNRFYFSGFFNFLSLMRKNLLGNYVISKFVNF